MLIFLLNLVLIVCHCLIESFFFYVQRLHEELYTLDPVSFFVPSFLDAVSNTSEENFKSIIGRAAPGIYTFDMLKPQFCQMLIAEVYENLSPFMCVVLCCLLCLILKLIYIATTG